MAADHRAWRASPHIAGWLATGVCLSVAILGWLGMLANRESQRSATLLLERRAAESARLLLTALAQDMRAVQTSILSAPAWDAFTFQSPQDVTILVASAFARYPYPETFLVSEQGHPLSSLAFFTRADRPPSWLTPTDADTVYPARMSTDATTARVMLARIRADAADRRPYSIFEVDHRGGHYQVVARLHYDDAMRTRLDGVCGFMVDTAWVHTNYFPELVRQIEGVGGPDPDLRLGVADEPPWPGVATTEVSTRAVVNRRPFPIAFFDPVLVAVNPPHDLRLRHGLVTVTGESRPARALGNVSVLLASAAAVALALGSVMTAKAVRANADLADLRTEFMSSVTHELKTPIHGIRALGETLSSGRLAAAAQREYGALVVQEATRLSRLVDNLLAHARITDIADVYTFEPLHVDAVVESALAGFRQQLRRGQFTLSVEIPPGLPPILADPDAMELLLDNLIDNAIRHSEREHVLRIQAEQRGGAVALLIRDRGVGIADDELGRVTQKFFRGRNAVAGGSGLGLAIATRIVADHGGTLAIASVLDEGTSVTVTLPIARPTGGGPDATGADAAG